MTSKLDSVVDDGTRKMKREPWTTNDAFVRNGGGELAPRHTPESRSRAPPGHTTREPVCATCAWPSGNGSSGTAMERCVTVSDTSLNEKLAFWGRRDVP